MDLNFRTKLPAMKETRELVQDLIQMFTPVAETRIVEVIAPYTVGMLVTLPKPQAPKAIMLARCYDPKQPTAVSAFTGAVDFAFSNGAARILELRGLTPGTTTYNLTFTVVYA